MKYSLLVASIFVGLLSFSSCSDDADPCEDTVCLNGGACFSGDCNCPDGFSGPNCGIQDPCFGISCLNGGECINGACDCPEGYSGPDCGTLRLISRVGLTKLTIVKWPQLKPNGGGWDDDSRPDIYPVLALNGDDIFKGGYVENADPTKSYFWEPQKWLNAVSREHTITINDFDALSDDYMGGFRFIPLDFMQGYPRQIVLGSANDDFIFHLDVYYEYAD